MDWILTLATKNDDLFSVLYSHSFEYPYNYTGYSSGVAGIGDLFLHLYSLTNNQTWFENALKIGNWLVENENNGSWLYGGVDYLTDSFNEDGNFLGLSAGSAGIGLFLLNLYSLTKDSGYNDSIQRIYTNLLDSGVTTNHGIYWPVQTKGYYINAVTTGLNNGIAGIGLFFNKYFRIYTEENSLAIIEEIHNYYNYLTTSEDLIPSEINASRTYYDSSLFEGLAGIGLFYLD